MKSITVNASTQYDVYIGYNLTDHLPTYLRARSIEQKAVIISDSNVWPIYGNYLSSKLTDCGFNVYNYVFPAGEQSKSLDIYMDIIHYLATNQVTRADYLIALGGGVVGDLTGFVAATYLRGLNYVQIPTSILAMVDSSVGGKTAIDHPLGKNMIGAFYQPSLVICDTAFLATLPDDILRDGCAEVIKYGILYDIELFQHLEKCGLSFDYEYVISRCIELKRNVVEYDEFDRGSRQKLNLGHTFGHAIESISQYSMSHGHSVAVGMGIISASAYQMGLCSKETASRIKKIILQFGFSTNITYTASALIYQILSDKKRVGNNINLIFPIEIGNCQISATPIAELQPILEAGLSSWTLL